MADSERREIGRRLEPFYTSGASAPDTPEAEAEQPTTVKVRVKQAWKDKADAEGWTIEYLLNYGAGTVCNPRGKRKQKTHSKGH